MFASVYAYTWGMKTLATLLLLAAALLSGCATRAPDVIRHAPVKEISVQQARSEPQRHLGQPVRWGGSIMGVENRRDASWVEVLTRPLDSGGYPDREAAAGERFLVRIDGFVDPAEYAAERLFTVVGQLAENRVQLIGEFPYQYAVVHAQAHHLWPVPQDPVQAPYPYYDPWYGPWYYPWSHRRYW